MIGDDKITEKELDEKFRSVSQRASEAIRASEAMIDTRKKILAEKPERPTPDSLKHMFGGSHYKEFAIEPAEFIIRNGLGFAEGNVIKYVSRKKGGLEDIMKAIHYCEMILDMKHGTTYELEKAKRAVTGPVRPEPRSEDGADSTGS